MNAVLAVGLAIVIAGAGWLFAPAGGVGAGGVVLALSAGALSLRGYLVPGTPALTKRYLPHRVLAWFGKAPDTTTVDPALNPEEALLAAGALEPCADRDDLCLSADFRRAWYDEIDRLDAANADRERLLDVLGVDSGAVFEDHGDAFRARVDGSVVGRWESEAAFLADLGPHVSRRPGRQLARAVGPPAEPTAEGASHLHRSLPHLWRDARFRHRHRRILLCDPRSRRSFLSRL